MQPRTVRALPADYQQVYDLSVTTRKNLILMNLAAIPIMLVSIAVFVGSLIGYQVLGAPLVIAQASPALPGWLRPGLVLMVLPLHEWLHGIVIQHYGHRVRYGIKPLKGVLFATADQAYFWRDQYVRVALAPLIGISAGAWFFSLILPPDLALWLMFGAAVNATGAIGDLWMVWKVRQYPAAALVKDEADRIRIFCPPSQDADQHDADEQYQHHDDHYITG